MRPAFAPTAEGRSMMKLREIMEFLQKASEDNLKRHSREEPIDMREIAYHEGQLSVLDVLIPRTPPDVEMLNETQD